LRDLFKEDAVSRRNSTFAAVGLGLALLSGSFGHAAAQQPGRVTGQVIDQATRQPIVGAQIAIQGTDLEVATTANGRYLMLNVPVGTHTIVVSSLGYADEERASVTVAAGAAVVLNIELRPEALRLAELVATGVVDPIEGARLPFVVSKLSGENLTAVPTTGSALAAIQGKVPGVQITRSSGQPGSGVSLMMRTPTTILGSSSPLYVVDGVILGTGTQDIESLDIESIEIIKGAAGASLYGSQGAAGVVQITTRRGRDLNIGATRMQLRTEFGYSQLPNGRPQLATHHTFRVNQGEAYTDANGALVGPGDYVDADGNRVTRANRQIDPRNIMDVPYNVPLYDNLSALFVPGQFMANNFSISQNFERTNYTLSMNQYREAGAVKNNDGYIRYNGRVNLDHRFADNLSLSVTGYHNRSTSDDLSGSPFSTLLYYDPTINLSARDSTGNYMQFPDPEFESENPIWRQATRDNWTKRERTQASANIRYSPLRWMRVVGQYSYDRSNISDQIFVPKGIPTGPFDADPTDGRLFFQQDGRDAQNGSLLVTMNHMFGAFNPRLTMGGTFESYDRLAFNADARDFAVSGLKTFGVATDQSRMSTTIQEERANGLLGDLALDYAGKYIGSFVVRRDGSSRYGPDNRWHTYYAVRGAYRIAEEEWWPLQDVVTEFKPRIALGTAGGRPTYNQQYETWSVSIPTGQSPVFSRGNAGNPMLAPEETLEQEYGLDVTLFRNHEFRFTYVRQKTDGLILQGVGPAAEGYFSRWENIGAQDGTTYEFEYAARVLTRPDMSWNTTFVADRSNSWISRWDRPAYPSGFRQMGLEGTLYDMWGRYVLTSLDELGTRRHIPAEFHDQFDVNDDGYVVWVGAGNTWRDGNWGTSGSVAGRTYGWGLPIHALTENGDIDRVKIGSSQPDFNFGFLNNFRYRNLSVHAHLRGQSGGNIYSNVRQALYNQSRHADLDQSGKPEESKKPRSYYQGAAGLYQGNAYASPFVEDASFIKLQALNVSYRFGQQQLSRLLGGSAPQGLTLGLNARNVFTLTRYGGWDPDVGSPIGRTDGINTYPNMRQFTGVVEITF
jgi:TonB-linked SusC/RagA family outer membrane protein